MCSCAWSEATINIGDLIDPASRLKLRVCLFDLSDLFSNESGSPQKLYSLRYRAFEKNALQLFNTFYVLKKMYLFAVCFLLGFSCLVQGEFSIINSTSSVAGQDFNGNIQPAYCIQDMDWKFRGFEPADCQGTLRSLWYTDIVKFGADSWIFTRFRNSQTKYREIATPRKYRYGKWLSCETTRPKADSDGCKEHVHSSLPCEKPLALHTYRLAEAQCQTNLEIRMSPLSRRSGMLH